MQRYNCKYRNADSDCMYLTDLGEFILYNDYAALEQRFNALSTKFSALVEENATLRKRLEPIECAWSTKSNYLVEEFIDVMYEAIEKAMELKEGE